jgi:hypothetical protein
MEIEWLFGYLLVIAIFVISLIIKADSTGEAVSTVVPFVAIIPCGIVGAAIAVVIFILLPVFGQSNKDLEDAAENLKNKIMK